MAGNKTSSADVDYAAGSTATAPTTNAAGNSSNSDNNNGAAPASGNPIYGQNHNSNHNSNSNSTVSAHSQTGLYGLPQHGLLLYQDPRMWSSSLCSCCDDVPSCCETFWLPWCVSARQFDASNGHPDHINASVLLLNACLCTIPCFTACARSGIKARFGIEENCCFNLYASCCLTPCALCQQHRELTRRGLWPGTSCCCVSPPDGFRYQVVPPMMGQPLASSNGAHQVTIPRPPPLPVAGYGTTTTTTTNSATAAECGDSR